MGPQAFVSVGAGAAAGALLRWWLGVLLNPIFPTFPLGTLAANIIGGYLMGLAVGYFPQFEGLPPRVRLLVTTGFLGGLTTFSTFSAETVNLFSRHQYSWGILMIVTHVGGSLAATILGILTAELFRI